MEMILHSAPKAQRPSSILTELLPVQSCLPTFEEPFADIYIAVVLFLQGLTISSTPLSAPLDRASTLGSKDPTTIADRLHNFYAELLTRNFCLMEFNDSAPVFIRDH